jgi:hypothetical protein
LVGRRGFVRAALALWTGAGIAPLTVCNRVIDLDE